MPSLKRRYLIIIIGLVLLMLTWFARIPLAEFLVSTSMSMSELEDVITDIQQLDSNQTRLSHLGFTLPTESGRLRLEAKDININYLPGALLTGKIDSLDINKLELRYEPGAESNKIEAETQQPLRPREIVETVRASLREQVFFNSLSLHRVSLNGELFSVLDGKTLRFTSASNQGAIYAKLSLLAKTSVITPEKPPANLPQIVITRLAEDELSAELRLANKTGKPPAKIELALNDNNVTGNYTVTPESLQSWLQAFANINDIADIKPLSGTLSLNFESDELSHANISAKSNSITHEAFNAENIELNISLEYTNIESIHKLKLLDGTVITATNINAGVASVTDTHLNITAELTASADSWNSTGTLSADQLTAEYDSKQLKLADLSVRLKADAESLKAEGGFSPAAVPGRFSFDLDHNLASGAGHASLKPSTAIDLNTEEHQLSQLLTPWPYLFDLFSGVIKLNSSAAWSKNENMRLNTAVSFENAGGNAGALVFSGLNFDHELEILPAIKSASASKITINHMDSGVTASNISCRLALEQTKTGPLPKLVVQALQGEILGGTIAGENLVYDLNLDKNSFLVKASDIDLAEIVKTQQLEGIKATGKLDGTLPIEINAQGVQIDNGGFTNKLRAGTIRYNPEAGTDSLKKNPLTGIALDALKDFRYSHLQAGVNYLPDGLLSINLELKGISPALDSDRPVHLNINTEQNLVSLLKSLRFAQGVSESIDDRVRRLYEQTNNDN